MFKLSVLSHFQRQTLRVQAIILLLSMIFSVTVPAFQYTSVRAAGGDFANTDFAAAGPYSYDHATGGGAYDNGSNDKATGLVESLEGSDFACGDVITFLTAIKVSANPVHANQTAEFVYKFLGDSTGQSGAAITEILNVKVNRGPVSNGMGAGGTDSGLIDDGGSVATLVKKEVVGTLFNPGSLLLGTVRVTDLEAGEQVIVRVDVRLSCQPDTSPTGNLQGQLDSGLVVSPVSDTINTGQQTIPFLKIGDLLGAGEPLLSLSKTVTTANGTCPGTETLTVNAGDTVKYCYSVNNPGTAELYNVSIIDDNATADSKDDFAVSLTGLSTGGLLAGATASGSALVTLSSAGTITNIATVSGNNNQTGQKLVSYTDQDRATVFVMGPANSAPDAINDSATLVEDGSVIINVISNDTDPDGNLLPSTAVVIDVPTYGTLVYNGDGSFTYTPNSDFNGVDSFTYQVCDAYGLCDTATVTINVTPVNDAPVATDDAASTLEDTSVVISAADLLLNDLDADGDTLSISSITSGPQFGKLDDNGDGTYTYTPASGYFGEDTFTYQVCDASGLCDTATVTIIVTPVNDAPLAGDDAATTSEDTAVIINVIGNDSDPENNLDAASVSIVEKPVNGEVVTNFDGSVTYIPNLNWSGDDSFVYQVCDSSDPALCDTATVYITVVPVNDAPVAADDAATTPEDVAAVIYVLSNDLDVDGDVLSIQTYSQPSNGSVTLNADGTFTYTPNTDWSGTDSFTYQVCDPSGACAEAQVIVEVTPVNDPPVASNDEATTAEEAPVTINVAGNDYDVDGNLVSSSATVLDQPIYGTLVNNGDGTFTYIPNDNFNGDDSFTYQICDTENECSSAFVSIYVTSVNDAPVALDDTFTATEDTPQTFNASDLLGNDSDIDGDTLKIDSFTQPSNGTLVDNKDGSFTYTPNANYCGTDSFSYTVSDGELKATAMVSIAISCVNDAPEAKNDAITATEDTTQTFNASELLGNDSDIDGDTLKIDSFTQPEHGTLVVNEEGTFTYTPNANYCGNDSFTYTISDGMGGTTTATNIITVACVNDSPLAQNDSYSTNQNTKLTVSAPGVLVNDSDPVEGSKVSVSSYDKTGTFGGTIVMEPNGSFTYTPAKDFAGYDTFTYTITDGQGGYSTATVTITVAAKNGRSIAVSWGDWTKSGDSLNGYFNVQNMSGGGYAVQLTSFAIQVQYKTSGGNVWTDIAANNCVFNPAAPTLLKTNLTVQFSNCQLGSSIPANATIRVTAVVGIFGHKDQGVKQLFISRLSK